MAEPFSLTYTPGQTVYPRISNSAGLVFDFDDDTFKAEGSVVSPVPTSGVSEITNLKGDQSRYVVAADFLAVVNPSLTAMTIFWEWRRRLGASPDLAIDDLAGDEASGTVRCGRLDPVLAVKSAANQLLDQPNTPASFWVWLEADGERIDANDLDPVPGIAITPRIEGAGADLLPASAAAPDAQGRWYVTFDDPGYGEDTRLVAMRIDIGSGQFVSDDIYLGAS